MSEWGRKISMSENGDLIVANPDEEGRIISDPAFNFLMI